jgi:ABC-type transport system involved in cytochrome c biogenesis permease subunit
LVLFLGVWANEAWGSYWSWDPKETWALITSLALFAFRITKEEGKRTAILGGLGFCYFDLPVNFRKGLQLWLFAHS